MRVETAEISDEAHNAVVNDVFCQRLGIQEAISESIKAIAVPLVQYQECGLITFCTTLYELCVCHSLCLQPLVMIELECTLYYFRRDGKGYTRDRLFDHGSWLSSDPVAHTA